VPRKHGSDDGPGDRLEEMDRLLRSVRFSPRASLGPELWGSLPAGHVAEARRPRWLVVAFLAVTLALGAAIAGFWRSVVPGFRLSTVDRCCFDLDGGGAPDDGIAVVTRAGEQVRQLTIYEDRDRSGTLTTADTVRFRRGDHPTLSPLIQAGLNVRKLCCLDYDGGGKSDDGLLIIGRAPDQIASAAIFESDGHTLPVLR